jgi:hypothetical protein
MSIVSIKTLKLSLDGQADVECQLTRAALVDEPETEELTTFCSTETSSTPNYNLELSGFQDYGEAESVFALLHTAYTTDPVAEIDCVLTVGGETRTFTAKPTNDPPFGGDAGSALNGDITLDVVGDVVDGTATP